MREKLRLPILVITGQLILNITLLISISTQTIHQVKVSKTEYTYLQHNYF